jgi:methionyl-tRNA formyltransferase
MRVVIATRYAPVYQGFRAVIADAGHAPVAVLTPGDNPFLDELRAAVGDELELLLPARRAEIAPLLEPVAPDLVVCMGFPWRVPADALSVPPLGWLNGHPSLLPRHRGPIPWAWVIRSGDTEGGITFHRMDEDFDTGPVFAQRAYPLGDYGEPEELYARASAANAEALAEALARVAAGEPGAPQGEGGSYESFFTADDVWLDLAQPAADLVRMIWAWQHAHPRGTERGPLLELDGETVRVLRASLDPVDGAPSVQCADAPLWIVMSEPVAPPSA